MNTSPFCFEEALVRHISNGFSESPLDRKQFVCGAHAVTQT